ncbi:MAG: hypothetical protein COB53_01875 [Elusimicrobia bacterium]|nr:MAG: hypothetical protein COB53_01875 [Elusimicrobiota bacterium]
MREYHRTSLAALTLSLLSGPCLAQETGDVSRGPLTVRIKTQGTVRAEDIFRIRSSIEGRIEKISIKPDTWATSKTELGRMLTTELAAMLDSRSTTPSKTMEARWQRIFKPTAIRCPKLCYIMKVFAQEGKVVKPNALLMEAAHKLRIVGRVRPGDSKWVKKGQLVRYWPLNDPKNKVQGRIESFILDTQGETVEPGGTFTILLSPRHFLPPNTEWEGEITIVAKKNVLRVPTDALLYHKGEIFLPVRVSTGVTSYGVTEITSGASRNTRFLQIEASTTSAVQRHSPLGPPPSELTSQTAGDAWVQPKRKRTRKRRKRKRPVPRIRSSQRRSRPRRRGDSEPFKIKRIKRKPGEIDVFPDDAEVDDDERFPSDNE